MFSNIIKNKALITSAIASTCVGGYYCFFTNQYYDRIVIVGGGTAGVGVAAMLRNAGAKKVSIIEPSNIHYYQPLWTLVGGGQGRVKDSFKAMKDVIPSGTQWIKQSVVSFQPDQNQVTLEDGSTIPYDYLVVAAGIQVDWDAIPGLREGLERIDSGVVSNYDPRGAEKTWSTFDSIVKKLPKGYPGKKINILFTHPPTAVKCAGASQKIMWMLEDTLRGLGLREICNVTFITPNDALFSVPYYSNQLDILRVEKGVNVLFQHKLVSLNIEKKIAILEENTNDGKTRSRILQQSYDMIHVTPPMSAPNFLKGSLLATTEGWVDVDKHTLQSTRYANVFALGDCTNTANSKTAAAVIAQAPVVVHNIHRMIQGKPLNGYYDGYGACPLIISRGKVLLAEFSYDKKLAETFHRDTGPFPLRYIGTEGDIHQRFFFILKKYVFPFVYWNLWTHGLWSGPFGLKTREKLDHVK